MAIRPILLLLLVLAPFLAGCSLFDSADEEPDTTAPAVTPAAPATERAATRTSQPATAAPPPTDTPEPRGPTQAPDGRTGIVALDDIIDTLLTAEAGDIVNRFGEGILGQLTIRELDPEGRALDVPPEEWSAALTASSRSLFTVVRSDPNEFPRREFNVVLKLDETEYWNFAVRESAIVEIVRRPEAVLTYPTGEPGFEYTGQANDFRLPSIERLPERYLVLPPPEYLPRQPTAHALSVRTGNANIDSILAALASQAPYPNSLLALVKPGVNRRCEENPEALVDVQVNRAFADSWALDIAGGIVGVYAIIDLPTGYQPAGEHLLIVVLRRGQLWWETQGILEAGGDIVGVISPAWPILDIRVDDGQGGQTTISFRDCLPLPPAEYAVAPPDGGIVGLDPARRSGIPLVDAILDALEATDAQALSDLTDYTQVPCVKPGPNFGQGEIGPACKDSEPEGTLVKALPVVVCHGGWIRSDEMTNLATEGPRKGLALYAIAADGPMVLASPEQLGEQWSLGENGLLGISRRCGDNHPDRLIGGDTQYLLPPP